MPYIKEYNREFLEPTCMPGGAGALNYTITKLCVDYLERMGTDYSTLNEIIGVLECAKLEFYRRACAPYEDTKIKENGDVY